MANPVERRGEDRARDTADSMRWMTCSDGRRDGWSSVAMATRAVTVKSVSSPSSRRITSRSTLSSFSSA